LVSHPSAPDSAQKFMPAEFWNRHFPAFHGCLRWAVEKGRFRDSSFGEDKQFDTVNDDYPGALKVMTQFRQRQGDCQSVLWFF